MQPQITIFMPVYNGAEFIQETLVSILGQTFCDFELLCVDDTSSDGSYEILKQFSITDSRIRLFRKHHGGNAPKSWNFALPYVRGGFIYYLSQDDLMSKDLLHEVYQRQKETDADVVVPKMLRYHGKDANGRVLAETSVDGDRNCITGRQAASLSIDWKIHGFNLWKIDVFRRVGGMADFGAFADEFSTRLLFMNCNKVSYSEGIFFFRQNNNNAITRKTSLKLFDVLYTCERLRQLFLMNKYSLRDYNRLITVSLSHIVILNQLLIKCTTELNNEEKVLAREKLISAYRNLLLDMNTISQQVRDGFMSWPEEGDIAADWAEFEATLRRLPIH